MISQKFLFPLFVILAIIQIFIPAQMIFNNETIIADGVEYKFKTAPVDPTDPFRGKYINLGFNSNIVELNDNYDWSIGDNAYVILGKDEDGYARLESVRYYDPEENDYIKTTVLDTLSNPRRLRVEYPFDRYYMKETKAYEAELLYNSMRRDTTQITYALVSVNKGNAVLKDVMINGESIKDLVGMEQE